MDLQNVSSLVIPEGDVRTIHDSDGRLLWGKSSYDIKYNGDSFQQTYSGKNLFNIPNGTIVNNGLTWVALNNTLVGNGKYINSTTWTRMIEFTNFATPLPIGTYTISIGKPITKRVEFAIRDSGGNSVASANPKIAIGNTSVTFTTTAVAVDFRIALLNMTQNETLEDYVVANIQLETGSTPTAFEPFVGGVASPNPDYPQTVNVVTGAQTVTLNDGTVTENYTIDLGSTELCKIGNYQDYVYKSGNDWYVHKATGNVVLDGSNDETWGVSNSGTPNFFYRYQYLTNAKIPADGVSNIALKTGINSSNTNQGFDYIASGELRIRYGTQKTVSEWRSFLSSTPMTLYYPLATPTDTQITDATLVGQLDAIHQFLTRYGYSATVSGNLPLIIGKTNL